MCKSARTGINVSCVSEVEQQEETSFNCQDIANISITILTVGATENKGDIASKNGPYCDVRIQGVSVNIMVDSGSTVTILSERMFKSRWGGDMHRSVPDIRAVAYGDTEAETLGFVKTI